MGAAGRDFHNFFVYYRSKQNTHVVCFTAEQIPGISKRTFPRELAGPQYAADIPIYPEEQLESLIRHHHIDEVALSYSDLPHQEVMMKASRVLAAGASFVLLGPRDTQLQSRKPVISVCAVRTGAGKSQTSRKVAQLLKSWKYNVVAVRHPMPYGILKEQVVERFATFDDLKKYACTIEEQEEYTPWIEMGIPVYAGVDYEQILQQAEKEADIIVWDGGNNDQSFYKPDLAIVVVDPHRAGHELTYYPGTANFLSADVIVINKIDSAQREDIRHIEHHIKKYNPQAVVIHARSPLTVDKPLLLKNKRAIVVEDGPTLTHGGMPYGAGLLAAERYGARIVDVEPYAVGSLKKVYAQFPHLKRVLPAIGYSPEQMKELELTINKTPADVVIDGSPFDMRRMLTITKPVVNVSYTLSESGPTTLTTVLKNFLKKV